MVDRWNVVADIRALVKEYSVVWPSTYDQFDEDLSNLLETVIGSSYDEGYDSAEQDHEYDFDNGLSEGYDSGYEDGYENGYNSATAE